MADDATAGDQTYVVQQGDCISSLAQARGFKWQTLWDYNPELRALRKNPNTLQPGDLVKVPALRRRYEDRPTDKRHEFVREGVPAKFRLVLERFDEPLANKKWSLTVDGRSYSGTTDGHGLLQIVLPPNAVSGHLAVPDEGLEYDLSFGYLDPSDEVSGAQARLQNLGFHHADITGEMDDDTRNAILSFQTAHGLTATGELDDPTRAALEQRHDLIHSQPAPESNHPPAEVAGEADQLEDPQIDEAEDDRRFEQFEQNDDEEQ
jgi:Putative peptidoglycan binding domain/LysM domain